MRCSRSRKALQMIEAVLERHPGENEALLLRDMIKGAMSGPFAE